MLVHGGFIQTLSFAGVPLVGFFTQDKLKLRGSLLFPNSQTTQTELYDLAYDNESSSSLSTTSSSNSNNNEGLSVWKGTLNISINGEEPVDLCFDVILKLRRENMVIYSKINRIHIIL